MTSAEGVDATVRAAKVQSLSWRQKVFVILKLLNSKPRAEVEIRSRIADGKGIEVYGGFFDTAVLKEALERKERERNENASAPANKETRPKAKSSPEKLSRAQQFAASKRYLDASKSAGSSAPPAKRPDTGSLKGLSPTSGTSARQPNNELSEAVSPPSRAPPSSTNLKCQGDHAENISRPATPCRSSQRSPRLSEASSLGAADKKLPTLGQTSAAQGSHRDVEHRTSEKFQSIPSKTSIEAPKVELNLKDLSVKDLKVQLSSHGVDAGGCVEKADLVDLWGRFDELRQKPLQELRSKWVADGNSVGQMPSTIEAIAARLLSVTTRKNVDAPAQAPPASATIQPAAADVFRRQDSDNVVEREHEAAKEVKRIGALKKERYGSQTTWAFAVLGVSAASDSSAVQKAYRGLMKKLHPDKVEQSEAVSKVLDTLKQAKETCERSVSRQMAPPPPRKLTFTTLCSVAGKRRYKIQWEPPEHREIAPVRKYIIAAFDPAYGKALNVAQLEPDYSEELRRFVRVEELREWILSEEELQKMPAIWKKNSANIQVAAANESGQSAWATLTVRLEAASCHPHSRQQAPGADNTTEADAFAKEFRRRVAQQWTVELGSELKTWLDRQKKVVLTEFMQSMGLSATGLKDALVEELLSAYKRGKLKLVK